VKVQISGKFTPDDPVVLNVRRAIQACGVDVTHPMSDAFIAEVNGVHYTFDPSETSIASVERSLFEAIRNCDLHVLANGLVAHPGLIGQSAAIETAFAICCRKPVMCIAPPRFSDAVPAIPKAILLSNLEMFKVVNILESSTEVLASELRSSAREMPYVISEDQENNLRSFIGGYLDEFEEK